MNNLYNITVFDEIKLIYDLHRKGETYGCVYNEGFKEYGEGSA